MSEFEFERGEILTNLVLLEDHAQKFQCPYCMEKHSSKIIGYAEEISQGGESVDEMEKLAADARKWRRSIQGAKEHSHESKTISHVHHNPRKYLPRHLTKCERKYPGVQKKLSRCIKKLEPEEAAGRIESAVAVCRASIKCPS